MKNEYLNDSKNRTFLYDLNQAIKKIFTGYRFIHKEKTDIILPLTMESVKSRPLYDNAFFINNENIDNFIYNSAINGDELNRALKEKAVDVTIDSDIVIEKEEKYIIGQKLTEVQIEDSLKHKGLNLYLNIEENKYIGSYKLTDIDIEELLNYNVLLNTIEYDNKVPIDLVMTKELFPFVKKASSIVIRIYKYNMNTKENIYRLLLESNFHDKWIFYNTIHIYSLY